MKIITKPWGVTVDVHHDEKKYVSVAIATGGFSSVHFHVNKSNEFFVFSGRLLVEHYKTKHEGGKYHVEEVYEQVLLGGQSIVIPAGVLHRFSTRGVPVTFVETYEVFNRYKRFTKSDIVRLIPNAAHGRPPKLEIGYSWERKPDLPHLCLPPSQQ